MKWSPLSEVKKEEINILIHSLFPDKPDEAMKVCTYWAEMMMKTWDNKSETIKSKDKAYDPSDPMSRLQQQVVSICYADNVTDNDKPTLPVLKEFISSYFPSLKGIHLLPACEVAENRFNDGYFSQVRRDRVHPAFGTDKDMYNMMEENFSMADFVLNHVDINNPNFQSYIKGNEENKNCFYIFSPDELAELQGQGAFDHVFRPRPYPLFTFYRRDPKDTYLGTLNLSQKVEQINSALSEESLPQPLTGILCLFEELKNDQMLLEESFVLVEQFINHLEETGRKTEEFMTLSLRQEVRHDPWILKDKIKTPEDFLLVYGIEKNRATRLAEKFASLQQSILGEPFFALTTFSHVQADLNTTTREGFCMLADDFSWYLSQDLNMLRLDAANFAFKKWGTSCFGLEEVGSLMKILYLTMECVSPRIVANLEVNDKLSSILNQMSEKKAPPPMMYDFHLACLLPSFFISRDKNTLKGIARLVSKYDIPDESIRFSLAESHDGKSVRGSMDLLDTISRQKLAEKVIKEGGFIKYKSVQPRRYLKSEWNIIASQMGVEKGSKDRIFKPNDDYLILKSDINDDKRLKKELDCRDSEAFRYFSKQILEGREPYELCISTRDILGTSGNIKNDANRYLSHYALAFALMGRHVKSIYFNDLMGLGNDFDKVATTGELRDIKRTKSDLHKLITVLADHNSFEYMVTNGMNTLIETVNSDPALDFRTGGEAEIVDTSGESVVAVKNKAKGFESTCIVNMENTMTELMINDLSVSLAPYCYKWIRS